MSDLSEVPEPGTAATIVKGVSERCSSTNSWLTLEGAAVLLDDYPMSHLTPDPFSMGLMLRIRVASSVPDIWRILALIHHCIVLLVRCSQSSRVE